jgi:phosphatidate cytidylyltransferase
MSFFIGKAIGGPKLFPQISPNKTWSGFLGGVSFATVLGSFFAIYFLEFNLISAFFTCFLVAIATQFGDLLESYLKRKCNVKDSGILIPGHGGMLDRVDGLLLAAILFYIILIFINQYATYT